MNGIKHAAQKVGHIFLTMGLCVFAITFFSMATNQGPGAMTIDAGGFEETGTLPNATRAQDLAYLFRGSGFFIVPGWLLLRFAAGLFPFGRRFSKEPR